MKSKNIYQSFAGLLKTINKHPLNYHSLVALYGITLSKVYRFLYQKLSSAQYKYFHYKDYLRFKNDLYIVYNLGKVGSTAIYDTLRLKIPHESLYHVHFLTENGLKRREEFHGDTNVTVADRKLARLIKSNDTQRLKIITLVREPVSREISAIFESMDIYFPDKKLQDVTLSDLQQVMDNNTYRHVLTWFDEEFNQYLNIDMYQLPFDKSKGYQIYQTEQADILLIKMEQFSQCFQDALYEFTGIHFDKLMHTNASTHKLSANLNEKFKKQYKASYTTLEKIYQSKYVQHFYTQQEIDAFIKKYSSSEQV